MFMEMSVVNVFVQLRQVTLVKVFNVDYMLAIQHLKNVIVTMLSYHI